MLDLLTPAELPLYVDERILSRFSEERIATAIAVSSSEAYCYLSAAYAESLTVVPPALKLHVANCMVKHLLDGGGRSPQGDDSLIDINYDNALKFYKAIQKSEQNLPGDTVPERDECVVVSSQLRTGSSTTRGW